MGLIDLTAEFIKTLNSTIPTLDTKQKNTLLQIEHLKSRMTMIKLKTSASEQKVHDFLKLQEKNKAEPSNYIIIRNNGNLKAIVSNTIQKPSDTELAPLEGSCDCLISDFQKFLPLKEVTLINTEKALFELDETLYQVCMCVYDHDYRSYNGFICYITIATPLGGFFVIDALKLREYLPNMKLFKCGVQKLIHCRSCVERLFKDLGWIGCYRNYDVPDSGVFIDWRIRPFDQNFAVIMYEHMEQLVNKSNQQIHSEKFEMQNSCAMADFIDKFELPSNTPFLSEILKLRQYLAKKHDEGLQYVLTDKQIISLLERHPVTVNDFENVLPLMSPILRPHVGDFILILLNKSKGFSLEKLKEKVVEAPETESISDFKDKHRSFKKNQDKTEDDDEDIIISSD